MFGDLFLIFRHENVKPAAAVPRRSGRFDLHPFQMDVFFPPKRFPRTRTVGQAPSRQSLVESKERLLTCWKGTCKKSRNCQLLSFRLRRPPFGARSRWAFMPRKKKEPQWLTVSNEYAWNGVCDVYRVRARLEKAFWPCSSKIRDAQFSSQGEFRDRLRSLPLEGVVPVASLAQKSSTQRIKKSPGSHRSIPVPASSRNILETSGINCALNTPQKWLKNVKINEKKTKNPQKKQKSWCLATSSSVPPSALIALLALLRQHIVASRAVGRCLAQKIMMFAPSVFIALSVSSPANSHQSCGAVLCQPGIPSFFAVFCLTLQAS